MEPFTTEGMAIDFVCILREIPDTDGIREIREDFGSSTFLSKQVMLGGDVEPGVEVDLHLERFRRVLETFGTKDPLDSGQPGAALRVFLDQVGDDRCTVLDIQRL